MFSKYYKGMLWESLPKGEEKEKLIAATDDELEKLYDKSKVEAMKIYRDYKNFKKTIKNGKVSDGAGSKNFNLRELSLLNDSIKRTLIDLLNKSYSLAKSEIDSAKGIVSSAAGSMVRSLRTAGGMLSSLFGGDPIPKTQFEAKVLVPIRELCKLLEKETLFSNYAELDGRVKEVCSKFKDVQASLEEYVIYSFKKFPDDETFESMPGVQVLLRILLGLAGVERAGKSISNDGTGTGKARANYAYKNNILFGGGLLALLVCNTVRCYAVNNIFVGASHEKNWAQTFRNTKN